MTRSVVCLLVVSTLFASLHAQEPALPVAISRTAPAPRAVLFDAPGDGYLWAKGSTYKMRFGNGAAMVVPLLGPRATRNWPLTLRLAEARIGARVLPLRAPTIAHEGDRVVLDHGSVREVWRLAADHAEQDFVVDAAGADEDIVVRLDVDTPLAAPVRDPQGGLRFDAAGLGSVHYGDAVIVDGAGRRLAQPVACVDGDLLLTVPATFVRAARGPITIDPVIRIITVDNSSPAQKFADAAYEATAGVWLVVYHEGVSDVDIIARRFDAAGNFLEEVAVDITTEDTVAPAVAANTTNGQFLVVWRQFGTVLHPHDAIRGRLRTAATTTQPPAFTIYEAPLLLAAVAPDVGGSVHADTTRYYVVWQESLGTRDKIAGCRVNSAGVASAPVDIANVVGRSLAAPSIAKAVGTAGIWIVAYHDRGAALGRDDVFAAAVHRDGQVLETGFALTNSNAKDNNPDVAGDSRDCLVVWQSDAGSDTNILGRRLRFSGSIQPVSGAIDLTQIEPGTDPALKQTDPRVASHGGCRWTYTYREEAQGVGNTDVFAAVVMGGASPTFVEGHVQLSAGGSAVKTGGIASVEDGGETAQPGRALATFFTDNVFGALLDGLKVGGGVTSLQTGCGGLLFEPGITALGEPALGSRFTVSLQVESGAASAMFIGLPSPPLTLCALGCALGVSPILFSVPAASVSLNVPCNPSLLLGTFAFQGVEVPLNPRSTCTIGVALRMTDTLLVTLR